MTVLLVGIGADTTNCAPTPPVYDDGRFEYVPIPERGGRTGTAETRTYGNTSLRHAERPLSSFVEEIYPTGRRESRRTGPDLESWPLHYDPNLEALTYGETASRAAYVRRLRQLEPGDIIAFYTGLQSPDGGPRHRYLIGAFTVDSILDCQRIPHDGERYHLGELPTEIAQSVMDTHAENAHAKRFFATGELAAPNDGLIIADGREPGGRFDRAVRISQSGNGPHHYLRDALERRWSPEPNGRPSTNAYLGGVKPAHLLDIDADAFWADLESYR